MAEPRKIKVMISSRASSRVAFSDGDVELTDLRSEVKTKLEAIELFDSPLFDVTTNETAAPSSGSEDFWQWSLRQIREADIVLVLYNGDAGFVFDDRDVGICHAEFMEAMNRAQAKVRMISLPEIKPRGKSKERNERFQAYVKSQSLFSPPTTTRTEALTAIDDALRDAIGQLVDLGVMGAAMSEFVDRSSLEWDLLDFRSRRAAMTAVLQDTLAGRPGSFKCAGGVALTVWNRGVVFRCDAIPAAMGVGAAREMVGQPFLDDYRSANEIKASEATAGPVHLIACHKGVTETQAIRMLGFPDATIVTTDFGVYLADDVNKIQIVFIRNCRNETTTRHGVQRLFAWLEQAGESKRLSGRAESRLRIVAAIADEASDR